MAMLQRSQMVRSCTCNVHSSAGLAVRSQMRRRLSTPSPLRPGQNQLACVRPMPIGYGQIMSSTAVEELRQKTVMQSFLGVGAPEAILVAVVALVVFGPKGLADAAKSLGQTLRAFQPTIREVVEVSQEIKGTLEQELGLDEIRQAATMRPTPKPIRTDNSSSSSSSSMADEAPSSSTAAAASSSSSSSSNNLQPITEDLAKQLDPEIELKRAMSEQAAWGGQTPVASAAAAGSAAAAAASQQQQQQSAAAAAAAPAGQDLSKLSLSELEAELARRKKEQQA